VLMLPRLLQVTPRARRIRSKTTLCRSSPKKKLRTKNKMKASILDWNSAFRLETPSIFEEEERDQEDFERYLHRVDESFSKLEPLDINGRRDMLDHMSKHETNGLDAFPVYASKSTLGRWKKWRSHRDG